MSSLAVSLWGLESTFTCWGINWISKQNWNIRLLLSHCFVKIFLLDCITQQSINLKIMLNNYSGHRFLDIVRNWVEWGSDMSADKAQHWFTQPSLVLAPSTKWLLWPWNTQYWKKFRNAWWRNSDLVKKKANSPWLQPSKMKVENDSYRITGELTSAKQLECFPSPWRNKLRENQLTDQKKKPQPNQEKQTTDAAFWENFFRLRIQT